jgi:plastocyanin
VNIKLIAYKPGTLTVAAGSTVTWHQMDPGVHTVTSGTVMQNGGGVTPQPDGKFDSGEIKTGTTYSHKFDTPGTYTYFCEIHPATMHGEITVR